MSLKSYKIKSFPRKQLNNWQLSGQGTNEYYYTGFDILFKPLKVLENNSYMDEKPIGSLQPGQFGWGNNDALGKDTVYVRLTDNSDPNTKPNGYILACTEYLLCQKPADVDEFIIVSMETSNKHPSMTSEVKEIRTDDNAVEYFSKLKVMPENEFIIEKYPYVLENTERIYIQSELEEVCIVATIDSRKFQT
ncbi:MAG: hypothetical protein D6834_03770 [Aquificota bacterium]|nr:MAG: hypothetical protein D6834_03770 [Aquificota bacterium]